MSMLSRAIFTLLLALQFSVIVALPVPANAAPATEAEVSDLEPHIQKGDAAAVRKALELSLRADGALAERLDIALGAIITRHPRVFLEELQRSGRKAGLDSLLANLGPTYVDRFAAQKQVLQERVKALQSVAVPELNETRLQCLKVLRERIEQVSVMNPTKG